MSDIEPLTDRDCDAACAIYNHWVLTSTATFADEALTPEEFRAQATFPGRPIHGSWALRAGGELAGYLLIAPYKDRCAYRETAEVAVYLRPEQLGRGLGGRALDFALDQARSTGLHTLLATICAENDASRRLFASRGFEEGARLREVGLKFGRRLDVVVMQRLVGSIAMSNPEERS